MVAVTLVRDRGVVDVVTTALHAEKHHEARNLVTVESEVISAARAHRLGHHEATALQPGVDRGHELRVVDQHRVAGSYLEARFAPERGGAVGSKCLAEGEHFVAVCGHGSPHRALSHCFGGNDVRRRAGLQSTDRDDGWM